ncbi:MAG: trypsin-like peptidase domain-containing protein [Lachnospiraceae bacterium]|nr:trypsin-like peptidase domain-containing protein [Lachnospiraceae bacterium]
MRVRMIFAVLLCLILSGCVSGGSEGGGTVEEESVLSIREMELLQVEDPDSENLAGMLQRNGSGIMVQIGAGDRLGSGVICGVEQDCLVILTAAHVLAGEEAIRVTFADGLSVVCDDFTCMEVGDAGLLRVKASDIPEENRENYLCAVIDREIFEKTAAGDGCIVMGSRDGVAAEAYEGVLLDHWIYMEDYGCHMMWVRAEGKPGMSGGGLFDRQGRLLGILSGENGQGEVAAVPLSLILAQMGTE